MADLSWQGGAPAVAQVQSWTFAGTWEADDVVRFTIGDVSFTATVGSTAISTLLDTLVAAWNDLDDDYYPQFRKLTASKSGTTIFRLTANTPGEPFVVTLTPLEANLSAADAQTIEGAGTATTGTTTTASSGPNDWSTAANWDTGTVPVNSDNVFLRDNSYSVLYGLNQSAVTLASLTIDMSFQQGEDGDGHVGLPRQNEDGYPEYLDTYLRIGATVLTIGRGPGAGSGRIKIDLGSVASTISVENSGQPAERGLEAVLIKGTSSSNLLEVSRGTVGVAVFPGETADLTGGLLVGYVEAVEDDAQVRCGPGVTMPTVVKNGGRLDCSSNITTFTQYAGETWHRAGAIATTNLRGGTLRENASGTCMTTAVTVLGGAHLDFGQDLTAKTVTPKMTIHAGARVTDPAGRVTLTNGFNVPNGTLADVDVVFGVNRDYTVA